MKTVVVILEFQLSDGGYWKEVTENTVFGMDCKYLTANEFLNEVKDLHKKHSFAYNIKNVIIG